jgi:hypothetical protein
MMRLRESNEPVAARLVRPLPAPYARALVFAHGGFACDGTADHGAGGMADRREGRGGERLKKAQGARKNKEFNKTYKNIAGPRSRGPIFLSAFACALRPVAACA